MSTLRRAPSVQLSLERSSVSTTSPPDLHWGRITATSSWQSGGCTLRVALTPEDLELEGRLGERLGQRSGLAGRSNAVRRGVGGGYQVAPTTARVIPRACLVNPLDE